MPSKKKITGQSNLTAPSEPLAKTNSEPLNLTTPQQKKPRLKNFLLNDLDCDRLGRLLQEANRNSPYKKISETALIRALLLLAGKMDIERIVKAARDA
ncbi:MAG: hypothetical protein FD122_3507 [Stygiobacter sp.]|nr:MAG: hypothetical protein FD122_3507 [Stygiobacter sp.]